MKLRQTLSVANAFLTTYHLPVSETTIRSPARHLLKNPSLLSKQQKGSNIHYLSSS